MIDGINKKAQQYHDDKIKELSDELVRQKDRAYFLRKQIANLEDELLDKRYELNNVYNTIGNVIESLQDELSIVHKEYKS